jgi:hypothetical protein
MLHEFISTNRDAILGRVRVKVAKRLAPGPIEDDLTSGVPLLLDQLVEVLRSPPSAIAGAIGAIGRGARVDGGNLWNRGLTPGQVIHGYGDVCQAVSELALETDAPITVAEFYMLNRCLDEAMAEAITEYARQREHPLKE